MNVTLGERLNRNLEDHEGEEAPMTLERLRAALTDEVMPGVRVKITKCPWCATQIDPNTVDGWLEEINNPSSTIGREHGHAPDATLAEVGDMGGVNRPGERWGWAGQSAYFGF